MRCQMSNAANPFWEFSLSVYGMPGVAPECLELQERAGINVMLLLFAAYSGARGVALTDSDIVECVAVTEPLHSSVVIPLRMMRRELKELRPESDGGHLEQMRNRIKSLELDAEQLIGENLFEVFKVRIAGRSLNPPTDQIPGNVARLLQLTASGPATVGNCFKLLQASISKAGG